MPPDQLATRLAAGPTLFPHSIDLPGDRVLLIELDERAYAAASFLDERILDRETKGGWAAMGDVLARVDPGWRDDAQWIFHIGHVGSTLVSRLLGALPEALALREPLVVRAIAAALASRDAPDASWPTNAIDDRVVALRRLLSRSFRRDQRVVLKATSFASEAAPALVAPGSRAILLHVSPRSYMATILAGPNSRAALAADTAPRLTRLARRLDPMPWRLWTLAEGDRLALGWATEMLSLQAAADALPPGAALWIDFDRFLADPAAGLIAIARHLELSLDAAGAARLAADPIMTRYSKAPEHGYSAGLRADLQAEAAREHGRAITAGLAWLEAAAARHPEVARALERG